MMGMDVCNGKVAVVIGAMSIPIGPGRWSPVCSMGTTADGKEAMPNDILRRIGPRTFVFDWCANGQQWGREAILRLNAGDVPPPQRYPEPPPRISTMLRWMVATDGNSLSLNSSLARLHASNARRFFCQSGCLLASWRTSCTMRGHDRF